MFAVAFFDIVLAVHVMAVVVAFGALFAYPVFVPWARHRHPSAMPALHAAQARIDRRLISPGLVVILAAGIYLASKADVWNEVWVSVPLLILVIIGGLSGAIMAPGERKLSELARRDLDGGGMLAGEYDALFRRVMMVGMVEAALVLVAIFFMVAKP